MRYRQRDWLEARIDEIHPGISQDLHAIRTINQGDAVAIVTEILNMACKAQSTAVIRAGRECFAELPAEWVQENLENLALNLIDLNSDWEYRRLLDLVEQGYPKLYERFCEIGLNSDVDEIRSTAKEYRDV